MDELHAMIEELFGCPFEQAEHRGWIEEDTTPAEQPGVIVTRAGLATIESRGFTFAPE